MTNGPFGVFYVIATVIITAQMPWKFYLVLLELWLRKPKKNIVRNHGNLRRELRIVPCLVTPLSGLSKYSLLKHKPLLCSDFSKQIQNHSSVQILLVFSKACTECKFISSCSQIFWSLCLHYSHFAINLNNISTQGGFIHR